MEIPADQERDYFSPIRTFAQLFDFQCFQLPYQPEKFAWQLKAYFSTEDLKDLVASAPASDCCDFTLSYFILLLVFAFQATLAGHQGSPPSL